MSTVDNDNPDVRLGLPHLEHYPEPGGPSHRVLLDPLPFLIGRSATANYVVHSPQISKKHTEIYREGKEFRIRDLGSTNGTFVNGQPIDAAPLVNGDIIHVAHKEFKFANAAEEDTDGQGFFKTEVARSKVPTSIIRGGQFLRELLDHERVRVVFQPIVSLDSGDILGYEALGRGTHDALSPLPNDLFRLAGNLSLAGDLSQLFRRMALLESPRLPDRARIFINLHPSEMANDQLVASLARWRKDYQGNQCLVLEVHEGVVSNPPAMRRLRDQLKDLDIELAYDDFGAGQARLTELAEVPPDFIKFDMSLVRGIDRAQARQDLVRAIMQVTSDLNVKGIAEGIETKEEARVCRQLGCSFGQGFLFGPPVPLVFAKVLQNV